MSMDPRNMAVILQSGRGTTGAAECDFCVATGFAHPGIEHGRGGNRGFTCGRGTARKGESRPGRNDTSV
jgi:hypothetical protein